MRLSPLVLIAACIGLVVPDLAAGARQGCGSRGGPGYRAPNGKCIGWAQLNKVCGNPPTTRCSYEGGAVVDQPETALGSRQPFQRGETIEPAPAPPTSNVLAARSDGVGCADQDVVRGVTLCPLEQGRDCDSERAALLAQGECFLVSTGTRATVEASSHSFEWLRVRIPGLEKPVWTDRALFLAR